MADKIDSTAWTGDTSHRSPEFTPEAKAEIRRSLIGAAVLVAVIVALAALLKEVI